VGKKDPIKLVHSSFLSNTTSLSSLVVHVIIGSLQRDIAAGGGERYESSNFTYMHSCNLEERKSSSSDLCQHLVGRVIPEQFVVMYGRASGRRVKRHKKMVRAQRRRKPTRGNDIRIIQNMYPDEAFFVSFRRQVFLLWGEKGQLIFEIKSRNYSRMRLGWQTNIFRGRARNGKRYLTSYKRHGSKNVAGFPLKQLNV
jgi:hypothetical protein